MEDNIYKAPTADLEVESETLDFDKIMEDKSNHVLGKRWLATFIDFAILLSFLLIPDYLLGNELYNKTIAIWLSLIALYFPVLESVTGYSIGKYICRIRVIDRNGNKPSFIKSIIRTLLRLIEVNPFLAGGIPAGLVVLFSKKGQRIGDMLAGTYVTSVALVSRYDNANNFLEAPD